MGTCAIPLHDKRAVAHTVGRRLTALYGKRNHYSPPLIKAALRRSDFPAAWDCWALSLYASADDFSAHHAAVGESCDYAAMHADMLASVNSGSLSELFAMDWFGSGDVSPFDSPSLDPSDSS